MTSMPARGFLALLMMLPALCGQTQPAAGRWEIQYFHDEDDSRLEIHDLKFPSPRHGVALGALTQNRKTRSVLLLSSDGGAKWTQQPLAEFAHALFFLNDSLGWMATDKGVWQTQEAGRHWIKLAGIRGFRDLHFADEKRGWAVGVPKLFQQTVDGGRHWAPVSFPEETVTDPKTTVFARIVFATGGQGIVAGWSETRRDDSRIPAWMDPEAAQYRRQWPSLSLLLQTNDGGKSWKQSAASIFGRITRVAIAPAGASAAAGLALVEFRESFDWPSEVHHFDLASGKATRVFREKDRAVTDALFTGGGAVLGAVESAGQLRRTPIPSKVRILRSIDLTRWSEDAVDYRAVATRVILAGSGPNGLWAATDTGMILRWVEAKQVPRP